MGNVELGADKLFKEYEHKNGRLLLKGIRCNSAEQVEHAIDVARKELANPSLKNDHDQEFNMMIDKMKLYLTTTYDVGDGMLAKKTPLQFAKTCSSVAVIPVLERNIASLNQEEHTRSTMPLTSSLVGKVDRDRVTTAKERLKELRNKGNK